MANYLIVGGGAAGMDAATAIKSKDSEAKVTIVTDEPYTHYNRPRLVHFLAEDGPAEALQAKGDDWYREAGISFVSGRRIVSVDAAAKSADDDAGATYSWDKLLLACGGTAFVPPVPGAKRPGVFSLRGVKDALEIRAWTAGKKKAVVVGGGLLGLENAYALSGRGLEVTVVEFAAWLLPRQLDQEGGEHLRRLLEAKGLRFVLADQAASIDGAGADGAVSSVALKSGAVLQADLVLMSVGVRSDTVLAASLGAKVNKGVVVDDRFETSVPGVYCAGDAAEHRGVCYGLWTVAKEQGRLAGLNMAGGDETYAGSVPSAQLKITGIDLYSAGDVGAGDDACPQVISAVKDERYRKLRVGSDGKAKSAMVIGDRAAIQLARKIMSGSAAPGDFENL